MPDDALSLMKEDHQKMRQILEELDSTTESSATKRQELLATMKTELTLHEAIEEEIFYPALQENEKAKEIVLEAYAEHNAVDMLVETLEQIPFEDERWKAQFTVIKENIEHHIQEEEGELFDKASQIFSEEELQDLGEEMMERKQQGLTGDRRVAIEEEEEARRQ